VNAGARSHEVPQSLRVGLITQQPDGVVLFPSNASVELVNVSERALGRLACCHRLLQVVAKRRMKARKTAFSSLVALLLLGVGEQRGHEEEKQKVVYQPTSAYWSVSAHVHEVVVGVVGEVVPIGEDSDVVERKQGSDPVSNALGDQESKARAV